MNPCRSCTHARLLHDSWGCREPKCGCGISIIYLTPQPTVEPYTLAEVAELLEQANQLVIEVDRVEESNIRELHARSMREQAW